MNTSTTALSVILFLTVAACKPAAPSPSPASTTTNPATPPPPPRASKTRAIDRFLSSDPKVLHLEFHFDNGIRTISSLHPVNGPSSDFETQIDKTVIRITGSITEQMPSAYRVTFERTVTRSGVAAERPKAETIDFPFGRVTDARIF